MRLLTTFVLGLAALSVGCGGSGGSAGIPQTDACHQAAKAACAKVFGCPSLVLAQLALGQSQTTCETMIMTNCGSTGFECAANQTYHPDKAQQCRDEFNAQTCDTVAASISSNIANPVASLTMSIPPCGQICTGSDGGASSGG